MISTPEPKNYVNFFVTNSEISKGVPVFTADGERLGESPTAAKLGITQVVFSRIVMASPGMGQSLHILLYV